MDLHATELFRFTTPASAGSVWQALTCPVTTARWFHGLALESDWRAGSPVVARGPGGRLSGEVLSSVEPRRLSIALGSGPGQPFTYLTWEVLDATGGGSVVRLYVDEPADWETEAVWLTVLSRLQSVLVEAAAGATASPG